jgi:hypothetical protein
MLVLLAMEQAPWGTYLATTLAHVRLLAGVDTLMNRQCRSLNKLLAAVLKITHVRADTAVNAFYRKVSYCMFGVAVQAPYRDVQGHCVARNPCRMWSTRMLWVGHSRSPHDRRAVDSPGRAAVAAEHMRAQEEQYNPDCLVVGWAAAYAKATGSASGPCAERPWEGTKGFVVVVARSIATSLKGVVTHRVQTPSPT